MALLFEEDNRRLSCSCGNRRINKVDVFTYLQSPNDKDALEEYLIETELLCDRCKKVVKLIKSGTARILS